MVAVKAEPDHVQQVAALFHGSVRLGSEAATWKYSPHLPLAAKATIYR